MHTENEVYFEIQRIGQVAKCTAIDSQTGVEVSILGSSKSTNETLKSIALRKLQDMLARQSEK
jgi:hypothetical protein